MLYIISDEQTYLIKTSYLVPKLRYSICIDCIVVNGEQFQSQVMTLTLIRQYPMSKSSEDFSYIKIYSNFNILEHLFFELSCLQTDRRTDRQTHTNTDSKTDRHTDTHTQTHTNMSTL